MAVRRRPAGDRHPRWRYTPAVPATFPRYLGCAPGGRRWVRVDLETGSTLVSAAFGLSWDHDGLRGLMRISCADGRELSASAVSDEVFDHLVGAAGRCVYW